MRTSVLLLVASFGLSACGDADSTAEIGNGAEFAAEEEVASTGDALLSSAASVWLPMQQGNTWTFTGETGATKTISFDDVGGGIAWLDGMSREAQWVGVASSAPNTLYSWNGSLAKWEPFYRFGYAVTSWKIGSGCDAFTLKRTATDATVTVPAGAFTGARTIGYQHNPPITARCIVPVLSSVTFAPGVGPIAFSSGGGEKFTLTSARVNGKVYPAAVAAVTAKLTFDKTAYVNKSNTIRCITTPCPGNGENAVAKFTYTVTNGTKTSQTWQFSSGCQFDVQLVSTATNKVVKSVADGLFCTQALTQVTLAPGQSKSYAGQLELALEDGTQLDGAYSAKAFMVPRQGVASAAVVPASANLTVSIVPAVP